MLKYFFRRNRKELDDEIGAVLVEMGRLGPTHDEYPEQLALLERLEELKANNRQKPMSRDTMLLGGANLLAVVAIAWIERTSVMTSKGFTFIRPMKTQ